MSDKKPGRIHEVDISRAALKGIASLEDLKKTEIFSHLPADKQESGYAQLWAELKPAPAAAANGAASAKVV